MYSSAMAPSRHFAMVAIRPPSWNSPTTQVHSPEPKLIGVRGNLDRRAAGGLDQSLHCLDVFLDASGGRLPLDFNNHVVGVAVGERAMPVGSVPSVEVELIHSLQI